MTFSSLKCLFLVFSLVATRKIILNEHEKTILFEECFYILYYIKMLTNLQIINFLILVKTQTKHTFAQT